MNEPPRWTLWYVVALSTITSIVLAVSVFLIHGPTTRPDELGYLLNGRVLAGHEETPLPGVRSFYQAGYSLVTAVGALFGASIDVQFRVSLFLNMIFVLLTGLALYALMTRHFSISVRWAALVAATISVAPSVAAYSLFAYAESDLLFRNHFPFITFSKLFKLDELELFSLLLLQALNETTINKSK
mgnify:CR=1 FL=1